MAMVEGAGVPLSVHEAAAGPAVVLAHGMADDHAAWDEVRDALVANGERRVLTYDRRGYGSSGATEPFERTSVHEQTEDLAAVVRALDAAPAVVVGADLAALAAIDLAQRHAGLVRALVLIDVPAFALVPTANEPLAAERQALEAALREGGAEAGVERWLALRGEGDPARLERARRDSRAFFADYAGQATLPLARRDLRGLALPVAVLTSEYALSHVVAASDAVAALIPGATRGDAADLLRHL